ncbi:hypothetical protein [Novosphingobium capsulatum]|uniref:hypothetical protein n=1 Tax=Novosphingobium capsulatum TaxID=13688 RepID=UPI002E1224B5|nr:hypothetical protein U0041_03880 [Novosphingobium capsulatum]
MVTPNRSTAVMARRIEPPDSLDYFPTQPWCTRALCEFLMREGEPLEIQRGWDPCCGENHMVAPMREYFAQVYATDVFRYGDYHGIYDFLDEHAPLPVHSPDWIFLNPPFNVGTRFIERAQQIARRGVAVIARTAFDEGADRYERLFVPDRAPTWQIAFSERVVMLKGRLIRAGAPDPFNPDENGQPRRASSATAYSAFIWRPGQHDTRKRWIGPGTRIRLERDADYPDYSHLFPAQEGPLL